MSVVTGGTTTGQHDEPFPDSGLVAIDEGTTKLSINGALLTQAIADADDSTTTVKLTASVVENSTTDDKSVEFDITVIQDPSKYKGDDLANPDRLERRKHLRLRGRFAG